MLIKPSDLDERATPLRFVAQLFLRIHGFVWRGRMRASLCQNIHRVVLRGNQIIVYHDAESALYKTTATWSRIKIPLDPETTPITVYIRIWPPDEYEMN